MNDPYFVVAPIPSYLVSVREFASRVSIVALVLITGWVELSHIGGYEVYWSRLLAVGLALLAWHRPWYAALGLIFVLLLPVAATNPGATLVALLGFVPFLFLFMNGGAGPFTSSRRRPSENTTGAESKSVRYITYLLDDSHAMALVLATPVLLEAGIGPLPLFLLPTLGNVRHSARACLGLLMALTLALITRQSWAAG